MSADQLQKQLKKRLETILKTPENQICCDCGKRGPRWASANLGVFMCIECSGIHRNLGVHLSFVRSVNLDSWTVKQVEFMEEWGNKRAAQYFESRLPGDYQRPNENSGVKVVEKFIRDKYEHRKWVADSFPPPNNSTQAAEPTHKSHHHTHRHSNHHSTTPQVAAPTVQASATTKPAAPVVSAAPKQEVNLLDFADPTPAVPAQPVAAPVNNAFGNGHAAPSQFSNFGNFNSAPASVVSDPFGASFAQPPVQQQQQQQPPAHQPQPQPHAAQSVDPFFGFGAAQPTNLPPAAPAQKPQASADAILSLYNAPPPQQHQQPTGMHMMGGYGQPQPGYGNGQPQPGYGNGFNNFPAHQQQFQGQVHYPAQIPHGQHQQQFNQFQQQPNFGYPHPQFPSAPNHGYNQPFR